MAWQNIYKGATAIIISINGCVHRWTQLSTALPRVKMTIAPEDLRKKEEDGEPFKPKKKHPTFMQNLSEYFTEYCNNTGIHGFKYIGEQERTLFERLWWLIVFVLSLYLCIELIMQTYTKWDTSPVIVSFAQSPTPVWKVPFPAVTICSETKSRQTVFNFTDAYHKYIDGNITEEEMSAFAKMALVCDNHLYNEGNKTTELDTIDFLRKVAPPFENTLYQCRWTNNNETCDRMFTPMLTEEGMCFTFNMLDREELLTNRVYLDENYLTSGHKSDSWTLENGYPADSKRETYPRRAMSAGQKAGLVILMKAFWQDLDFICRGPVQGYKILLHNPTEIPRVSSQYFRAPLNTEAVVSIKPDMITTSEGLKGYDPHRRKCYLQEERKLLFFKSYTQQNCQLECLVNRTLEKCGCVAYHMPHEESTKICGSGSIMCMKEAEDESLVSEVEANMQESGASEGGTCDCLPSCTSLTYNAEISQANFLWQELFYAYKVNFSELPGVQFTRVTLFFKEQQFITSERNELYGLTDFLANCGGLLGLFTGFSFLSTVEILYFISIRFICNIRKFGKHFWSGSPELLNNDAFEHPVR